MKKLSQVLNATKPTAMPMGLNDDSSAMPPLGSTIEVGKTNTLPVGMAVTALVALPSNLSINEPKKPLALRDDADGRKKLSALLLVCFDVLKVYGKEPEQLENIEKIFQMILGKYPFAKVEEGFLKYMERKAEMPTPADIVNIIDPYKPDYSGVFGDEK